MLEDIRPVPPVIREAVRDALVGVGCPVETARHLAEETTAERHDGVNVICLMGVCVDGPSRSAIGSLASNIAADNAEAHDRTARGERGYEPLWPMPGRKPRRG